MSAPAPPKYRPLAALLPTYYHPYRPLLGSPTTPWQPYYHPYRPLLGSRTAPWQPYYHAYRPLPGSRTAPWQPASFARRPLSRPIIAGPHVAQRHERRQLPDAGGAMPGRGLLRSRLDLARGLVWAERHRWPLRWHSVRRALPLL